MGSNKRAGGAKAGGGAKRKALVGNAIAGATDTAHVPSLSEWASAPEQTAAAKIRAGMDGPNSSATVMCARCNSALDANANIDALLGLTNGGTQRLVCAAYRSLLPNLMGFRPERSRSWVLRVMRCLLRSKRRDDFLADRCGRPRVPFPEWAYAWFSPRADDLRGLGNEGKMRMAAEADENRWGLYYGVKRLMKELPEARLFWTFLDEKYGEDDLAFYMHAVTVLEGVVAQAYAELDWGPLTDVADFSTVVRMMDEMGEEELPDFVFIEVRHGAEVVKRVMSRSGDDEQTKALRLLAEFAVATEAHIATSHTGNKMIDVSVVLRVLQQQYRDERAKRRAAMRLMFNTATAGGADQDTNTSVDLTQLTHIVDTLNPGARPLEAVTLYRAASEVGRGRVTYEAFSTMAEKVQFHSRCLRLPTHYGAEHADGLTKVQCAQLGDVVRKHAALLGPFISELTSTMDAAQQERALQLYNDLRSELGRGGLVLDGRRALCAMRRLLEHVSQVRAVARELHGCASESLEPARVVPHVDAELSAFAVVLRGGESDVKERSLAKVQQGRSASTIQRRWRTKRNSAPPVEVPDGVRSLLSAGFDPYLRPSARVRPRALLELRSNPVRMISKSPRAHP